MEKAIAPALCVGQCESCAPKKFNMSGETGDHLDFRKQINHHVKDVLLDGKPAQQVRYAVPGVHGTIVRNCICMGAQPHTCRCGKGPAQIVEHGRVEIVR